MTAPTPAAAPETPATPSTAPAAPSPMTPVDPMQLVASLVKAQVEVTAQLMQVLKDLTAARTAHASGHAASAKAASERVLIEQLTSGPRLYGVGRSETPSIFSGEPDEEYDLDGNVIPASAFEAGEDDEDDEGDDDAEGTVGADGDAP